MWPLQRLILLMDEGADRYCSLQLVLEVGNFLWHHMTAALVKLSFYIRPFDVFRVEALDS